MRYISRKEAKDAGGKRYFTGKACPRGHIAERFVSNGGCYECLIANSGAWFAANVEGRRAQRHSYRAENSDKLRAHGRAYYAANHEECRSRHRAWKKVNSEKNCAAQRAREARKLNAMPAWACKRAITNIYAESNRLTTDTGVEHHVDHVIPLKHPLVCGLHVENNLQILTAKENMHKHNRFMIV